MAHSWSLCYMFGQFAELCARDPLAPELVVPEPLEPVVPEPLEPVVPEPLEFDDWFWFVEAAVEELPLDVELELAALDAAAPPPVRAPQTARARIVWRIRCRMLVTSFVMRRGGCMWPDSRSDLGGMSTWPESPVRAPGPKSL